jgi:upstream activation factor subunit UAF30
MPSKSKTSKSKTSKSKTAKSNTSKSTKKSKKVVENVSEEPVVEEQKEEVKTNKRVVHTKESVTVEFDELIEFINKTIKNVRESDGKVTGVKNLRTIGRNLKALKRHSLSCMKNKKKVKRNNANSGFLKPVNISKEMVKFTGWKEGELKSRVDVTKYICNYIKENNLQNPEDRRQILVDKKLGKLLDYDSSKEEPLTYYKIQTHIKKHFSNP